jgi:hypothetical protein
MTDEEFEIVRGYLADAWPKTHEHLPQRWYTQIIELDNDDVFEAIDHHLDVKQSQYGPSLEELLTTIDQNAKKREISTDRRRAPMMFEPSPQAKGRDKALAKNALQLCYMLITHEIKSDEAAAYCREVLSRDDLDNSGDYYAMAASIEAGAAEAKREWEKNAVVRETTKKKPRFAPEPRPDDNEKKMIDWVKARREAAKEAE